VEREVAEPLPCDREQAFVEVDALAVEASAETGEVLPCSARDVEQRSRLGRAGANDLVDARALGLVVLERVLEVVELRASRVRDR
jgi:hypothetical protein